MDVGTLEAQKAFLSCCLLDNVLMDITTVRPEFLDGWNAYLYKAMLSQREKGKIVSTISLISQIDEAYIDYVYEIAGYMILTTEFETYQDIIVEEHNKRKIKSICQTVLNKAEDKSTDAATLATLISDGLVLESKEEGQTLFPGVIDTFDQLFTQKESIYNVNTTGYKGLDGHLGGRRSGSLYIIAARPGIGKSTLMLNLMLKAIENKADCSILSVEMPTLEIHIRAMSNIAKIESRRIENGLSEAHEELADKLVAFTANKGRCSIYDNFYAEDLERIISKEAMKGAKIIFLDYLQIVPTVKPYANKNNYIESLTNKLKSLAIKYGLSIVALSQLKRTEREPELTDLRDSGAIEQDADVVMFLYNDDEYNSEIDVLVKKNRHRDKGSIRLKFNKKFFIISE